MNQKFDHAANPKPQDELCPLLTEMLDEVLGKPDVQKTSHTPKPIKDDPFELNNVLG